jgi:hypothetical protein
VDKKTNPVNEQKTNILTYFRSGEFYFILLIFDSGVTGSHPVKLTNTTHCFIVDQNYGP